MNGNSLKSSLTAVALAALLAGCSSISDERTGSGPVALSPSAEAGFQDYLRLENPGAFAVSKGGAWGYSYCEDVDCRYNARNLAIASCEKHARGKRCLIHAVGTKVVWRAE
jgi:hypothetical protein